MPAAIPAAAIGSDRVPPKAWTASERCLTGRSIAAIAAIASQHVPWRGAV